MKVLLLKGGFSSEREISLITADSCLLALKELGHDVVEYDLTRDIKDFIICIEREKPHVVFNALHGKWGEDGCIQGVLNIMGVPYTHSNVCASSVAMDKDMTKKIARSISMDLAKSITIKAKEITKEHMLPIPYVIKPACDGSSCGIYIVTEQSQNPKTIAQDYDPEEIIMLEEYIQGRELTVGVLNGQALAVTEIKSDTHEFFDFKAKYTKGEAEYILPAQLDQDIYEQALHMAQRLHNELNCTGVTRTDFRYDEENKRLVMLELNNQPGMTSLSLVPKQAEYVNIPFSELIKIIIDTALIK